MQCQCQCQARERVSLESDGRDDSGQRSAGRGLSAGTTGKWNGLTGEEGRCSADSRVRNSSGRGGEDGHATMMVVINVVIGGRNCGGPFLEFVVCCCYNGKWYPG